MAALPLATAAGVLLALEGSILLRERFRRNGTPLAALLWSAASLVAGPLLAAAGLFLYTIETGPMKRGGPMLRLGLRGSLILLSALLAWRGGATGAILALAILAVLWSVRAYQRTTRPIPRGTRIRLVAVRTATILLAALWALRPIRVDVHEQRMLPVLLIGVDRSASMDRRDERRSDGTLCSRREAVQQALRRSREDLRALARQAEVVWFSFAETASPPVPAEPGAPPANLLDGSRSSTAIGDAAEAAVEAWAAGTGNLAGVVLLTDGSNNLSRSVTPETFAARLGTRGIPVHTVGAGSPTVTSGLRSLTVRSCGSPTAVNAYETLTIRPVVEALGLADRDIEVSATFGETLLGRQRRRLASDHTEETFEFTHVPMKAGFHRLSVRARLLGEAEPMTGGQPDADMLVQVTDREIRVLYIEGTYRYEIKYIARALAGSKRISLHRWILNQPLGRWEEEAPGEDLEDWLGYHVILLGDVPAERFSPKQRAILKALVGEYGKGLAMIGGEYSFGRGGWGETELADVLPVDVRQSREQIRRPVQPRPTPEGETSDLLHIGPPGEKPSASWAKLDPLPGANLLTGVKPAATVLADLPSGEPMLVAQSFGKGRALAIAFDTTWRWVLSPREENTEALQKRFWRQVVLYLADPTGNVWIHTDRTTYDRDALERGLEEITLSAGAEDARGRPRRAEILVTLREPDGHTSPVTLSADGPIRRGLLPAPHQIGVYTLTARTELKGKTLQARQQFEVLRQDPESRQVLADFRLLRAMARASRGSFQPLAKWPDLLRRLRRDLVPLRRTAVAHREVLAEWRWPSLILLVGLLCAEWGLRKKRGLV